jgi:phosphoglycolate phosphatase
MIGGGARVLLERGLAIDNRKPGEADMKRMLADFIDHYARNIAVRSRPFEGLETALDALADQGYAFAVCTNKLEWLSLRLLEELSLRDRFVAVCGGDTFGKTKPDPHSLLRTIARAGGAPERTVMVGDSAADVGAARGALVPIVGVTFGYTDVPIAELSPDRVIGHMSELAPAVNTLMNRPKP